jgi:hypothetical protein
MTTPAIPPVLAKSSSTQITSWLRLKLRVGLGKLFNLAGIPGMVRECDYIANTTDAQVSVRVRELFTIVTVNGLEIYFHRLTGTIDGVGHYPIPPVPPAPKG